MSGIAQAFFLSSVPLGQQLFIGADYPNTITTTFTVPDGVREISVLCIGRGGTGQYNSSLDNYSGGGGGGGALSYTNNISVTPGETLDIVISSAASYAERSGTTLVKADAGSGTLDFNGGAGGYASFSVGAVKYSGGRGGNGLDGVLNSPGGGGGAAGYAGSGGNGADNGGSSTAGAGGGGGGGGYVTSTTAVAGGGGGVGVLGQGSSGAAGGYGAGGGGGSGGQDGYFSGTASTSGDGGNYGGGGGGGGNGGGNPGKGAIRIIWGPNRAFPSTNTGDL